MSRIMQLPTTDLDVFMARKRNTNVFREGDQVGPIYQVETGCVRIVKSCDCGQRCILAFCFPGDLFGLGSQGPGEIDAEAASDTKVSKMTASRLGSMMRQEPQRALSIISAAHGGQSRHSEHFSVVSYGHADEKIAWFLNCLAARALQAGFDTKPAALVIDLPMPRGDIADHLGMKLETVSRELAKLKEAGVIETIGFRKIIVRKPRELAQRAELDAHETRKAVERNSVCDWMPAVSKQLQH
ncbi:MAG: helix-turn-helix domain-containing protein [Aquidulcibacter sp.]|jgi:CRP-like cAMP-binding protein|nr:helix-turn-helix domain-containing protein [Aquidulcibacter sp.]